jgi:uncharacterized coiled-coil DUF342 family protein
LSFFISHDQSDQYNFKLDWKTRKVSKMSRNCECRNVKNEQKKIMEDLKLAENEAKKKTKEAEELKKKFDEMKKKAEEIENEFKLKAKEAEEFQKKFEEIREISKQFEDLDESEPGKNEDLETSEREEKSYDSHRVLSARALTLVYLDQWEHFMFPAK